MRPVFRIGRRRDADINSSASLWLAFFRGLQARRLLYFYSGFLWIAFDVFLNFEKGPFISNDVIVTFVLPQWA